MGKKKKVEVTSNPSKGERGTAEHRWGRRIEWEGKKGDKRGDVGRNFIIPNTKRKRGNFTSLRGEREVWARRSPSSKQILEAAVTKKVKKREAIVVRCWWNKGAGKSQDGRLGLGK